MLGYGLLFAGAVFLWAAFTGRADSVFTALSTELSKFDPTVPSIPLNDGKSGDGGAAAHNQLVGQFDVALPGGGSVRTNASDPAAAIDNVKAQTGLTGTGVTKA